MRLTQSLSYLLLPTLIHAVEMNVEAEKNGGRDAVITNLIIQTRKFWHTSKLLQYLKTLKVDWADGLIRLQNPKENFWYTNKVLQ